MIGRAAFIAAHKIVFPGFFRAYNEVVRSQYWTREELEQEQNHKLKIALRYAYDNVPYYRGVFEKHQLKPEDIRTISDLQKLPILTKEDIRNNWEDLKPIGLERIKFYEVPTGGTTGTPLIFRLSKLDRMMSGATLYRGWSYAGYRIGDGMVYLAGSALGVDNKVRRLPSLRELARNARMLSSFDMSETELKRCVRLMNSFRPRFVYGYPSALDFLSKWIAERRIDVHRPTAVFVTSEKLHPRMRRNIESAFGCEVFDNYGLNDGGVSAFECREHSGLHIDTERSVMEVVDEHGNQLEEGEGKILATSLNNEAMPFIRYDTEDIAELSIDSCNCGRNYRLLKSVVGRTTDILYTPDGTAVHGWFFLYLFWEHGKGIKQYQVVQEELTRIVVSIVPDDDFDEAALNEIARISKEKCASWEIEFRIVDSISLSRDGKTKFIANRLAGNRS
jgi:phenylacetate-CoA ligase